MLFITFLIITIISLFNSSLASSPDIVIVGAGLSGISAASKLLEHGYKNLVVLEAEDRIGGRVHTIPVDEGGFIDLGAQLCHGEKGNAVYEMANSHFEFGRPNFSSPSFCLSNGKIPNQEECSALENSLVKIYESSFEHHNDSVGNILEEGFEDLLSLSEYKNIDRSVARQLLACYRKQLNGYFATNSLDDVSAYYSSLYSQDCEGLQTLTWKNRGFKTVFDFITKKLPNPSEFLNVESKVQLGKEVVNINWDPTSDKVSISCSDGSKFLADHLIFTGSLGVLKDRHQTLFTPELPENKVKAINSIGYGTLGKVFLMFDEPLLEKPVNDLARISILWTDEDLAQVRETDREWLVDMVTFLGVDEFPNMLQMFVSGEGIPQFEEISDQKLIDDCVWLLEKFLRKPIPRPKDMRRTKWFTNNNFLGSYSYLSIESEKLKATPNDLAQSLVNSNNKPIVLFAGEATHNVYSSYSHGAIMSGWRAAEELIGTLQP